MIVYFIIFITLVIMLLSTYSKFALKKKSILSSNERRKYKFYKSDELHDTVIQVAIVFLGAFLAMTITENVNKQIEYDKCSSMMKNVYLSNMYMFLPVYDKIREINSEKDLEEQLDDIVDTVIGAYSDSEQEILLNDYVVSTLAPSTMMELNMSYGNLKRCVTQLKGEKSKEEKINYIIEYCFHCACLQYDYDLLRKIPDFELLMLVLEDIPEESTWAKSEYAKMYYLCIDIMEESFDMELNDLRSRNPYG